MQTIIPYQSTDWYHDHGVSSQNKILTNAKKEVEKEVEPIDRKENSLNALHFDCKVININENVSKIKNEYIKIINFVIVFN